MPQELSFGLVESAWDRNLSYSVRSIYDLFSHVETSKVDSYLYERAVGPSSLEEVMKYFIYKKLQFICISCHGSGGQLKFGKTTVRCSKIAKLISNASTKPAGLFVDSCGFAKDDNARRLLSSGLIWFASYGKDAEWLKSVAFALQFWLVFRYQDEHRQINRIKRAVQKLKKSSPGLIEDLDFQVFIRKGNGNAVINLVAEN